MILSINVTNKTASVSVNAATRFVITAPTNNKLAAAGYIDIKWTNANSYGTVKQYKVYADGKLETTTKKTSYEFYTTKVNYHTVWIEADLSNGDKVYTPTVKFGVSKKGLGIDAGMGKHIAPYELNISWYYTWGRGEFPTITENSKEGVEFAADYKKIEYVPMVWSAQSYSEANNKVNQAVSKGYKYILGYNEPDLKGQAGMTVADAISYWPAFMNKGMRVGSPATAGSFNSVKWFQPFMKQINATPDLDVDFITIHSYPDNWNGGKAMADWFLEEVIDKAWEMYHKPIWVTEFSTDNDNRYITESGTRTYIEHVLPGLDKREYVERYAFFSFNRSKVNAGLWYYSTGALSSSGEAYRDYGNPTTEYRAGNLTNPRKSNQDAIYLADKKPVRVKMKSVSNLKGKKVKVTYKKIKKVSGYQIRIGEGKKFRGYWNKNTKKTSYIFKRLDKNTRYYIKVRAYVKNGKKKIYGPWSKAKSVKVKK